MISVLVVEDELVAAEALVELVDRLPGFKVAGQVRTGAEAHHWMTTTAVDLVLLDIYLPDMSGLDLLRRLRGAGNTVDVIALTRATDLSVVQAAVAFGVLHYLVKPFTSRAVRQRLERYREYRSKTAEHRLALLQHDIDDLQQTLRRTGHDDLPKGINHESLQAVVDALRKRGEAGVSADELAHDLGTSRVTARRYLEYLVDSGQVLRRAQYHQRAGRPRMGYHWPSGTDPS